MKQVHIRDLFAEPEAFANQMIQVSGWVRTIRSSKAFGFIELNDGTYFSNMQVVFEKDKIDNFEEVSKFTIASALTIEGEFVLTPDSKQPFELKATKVVLEAGSDSDYPLQKKRHTFEYLRTIAHLRPRSNTFSAVFRVRSVAAYAIHKFFQERGYVYVHTPIITGSDCEGAGEMFRVTTHDLKNVPMTDEGHIDDKKDLWERNKPNCKWSAECRSFCACF